MTDRGPVGGFEFESGGQYGRPQIVQAQAIDGTTVRVQFDQKMKHTNPADGDDVLNPSNYAFVVTGGVPVAASSVALHQSIPTFVDITLNNEMTSGSSIQLTVSNVISALGQIIDPSYDTYTFTGFGYKPQVQDATAIDGVIIEMTFNEAMSTTGLTTPSNYTILTGVNPPLTVISVDIISSTVVRVWIDTPMVVGGNYTIVVANVTDLSDNPIDDPPNDRDDFVGVDVQTKLDSAEPVSDTKIRLNFSKPMLNNAELRDISNYILTPVDPETAPLYFSQILIPGDTYPEYVEIPCSEMTNGKTYNCEVSITLEDRWGNHISPSFNDDDFTGQGTPPVISRVVSTGENRAVVYFNEDMRDNADIRNPANYAFDQGLAVLSVLDVSGERVELVTSDQTPGVMYTLQVTP